MPTKCLILRRGLGLFRRQPHVLSFENLGWVGGGSTVALALFFGGIVEIAVGFAEFWTGNTFAMTVFGLRCVLDSVGL